jgi:hypothetical protein
MVIHAAASSGVNLDVPRVEVPVEHFGHAIIEVGDVAVERHGHDCDNLRASSMAHLLADGVTSQELINTPCLRYRRSSTWPRMNSATSAREIVGKPRSLRRSPTRYLPVLGPLVSVTA